MLLQRVEKLRLEYTDKYVLVDCDRPNLARFAGKVGRVHTVNAAGRALVEFDGDRGRYDLEIDFLKVVEKPKPKEPAKKPAPAKVPATTAAAKTAAGENLSQLELARQEKDAKPKPAAEIAAGVGPAPPA